MEILQPTHILTVEVSRIYKTFQSMKAVNDLSFSVQQGEIFGLIGPNGAGKTTTIRMLLDIIRPDSGGIRVLGAPITEETKNRIGYLPEERGLYRKLTVAQTLSYLAALKDVPFRSAHTRSRELLEQVEMSQHMNRKIEDLSRGMAQIIQFVATIIHDPELVILDEPFSALDPVNTQLIKSMMLQLKSQGKTVILSTHLMNEVEELCDRVLMVDKGQAVLYGNLRGIKDKYRDNSVLLDCEGPVPVLPDVGHIKDMGSYVQLVLDTGIEPQQVLKALIEKGVKVNRFELATPRLSEIFIRIVQGATRDEEGHNHPVA